MMGFKEIPVTKENTCSTVQTIAFLMIFLVVSSTLGCAQHWSLTGTSTESLRSWDRQDADRHKLLVFVHGFNSDKEAAWGEWPDLVQNDDAFGDYNLLRWGYPTKICGQVSDIRHQGSHLASLLKEELRANDSAILVGHSMGGLVVLHALLSLERENAELIKYANIKVLTFGTPFSGVPRAKWLPPFCENKQLEGLQVLNTELHRLKKDWKARVDAPGRARRAGHPLVPVYAFYGAEDDLVPEASACGGPVVSCDQVDGDHSSMVKPKNWDHLAYRKLLHIAGTPIPTPTPEGQIGIWVSRLMGDEDGSAQRSLLRTLEFFLSRESENMREAIEVRELPRSISGKTLKQQESQAKRLGEEHNAAILIWGEMTGLFERASEFHPRITVISPLDVRTKTPVLAPVTEASYLAQLSQPPETLRVPPQPFKEPVQASAPGFCLSALQAGKVGRNSRVPDEVY